MLTLSKEVSVSDTETLDGFITLYDPSNVPF